jgi:hypothetical protein
MDKIIHEQAISEAIKLLKEGKNIAQAELPLEIANAVRELAKHTFVTTDDVTAMEEDLDAQLAKIPSWDRVKIDSFQKSYNNLPEDIKTRASWEDILKRLIDKNGEKLKLLSSYSEFFGIDKQGRALFRIKGSAPVLYALTCQGKILSYFGEGLSAKAKKWANYHEVRKQVIKEGYELFPYDTVDGKPCPSDEMEQVMDNIGEPLVEKHATWLESGHEPNYAYIAHLSTEACKVIIQHEDSDYRNCIGAVYLLRV